MLRRARRAKKVPMPNESLVSIRQTQKAWLSDVCPIKSKTGELFDVRR